jgi:hypothetical protein
MIPFSEGPEESTVSAPGAADYHTESKTSDENEYRPLGRGPLVLVLGGGEAPLAGRLAPRETARASVTPPSRSTNQPTSDGEPGRRARAKRDEPTLRLARPCSANWSARNLAPGVCTWAFASRLMPCPEVFNGPENGSERGRLRVPTLTAAHLYMLPRGKVRVQ